VYVCVGGGLGGGSSQTHLAEVVAVIRAVEHHGILPLPLRDEQGHDGADDVVDTQQRPHPLGVL
jgi:hypothetical protein